MFPDVFGVRLAVDVAALLAFSAFLAPSFAAAQSYTRAEAGLTGVELSSSSVGDVNGDGHLDLLITGSHDGSSTTVLYLGDDQFSFIKAGDGLTGVSLGASSLGDFDEDGQLDVVLTGQAEEGVVAKLYVEIWNGDED